MIFLIKIIKKLEVCLLIFWAWNSGFCEFKPFFFVHLSDPQFYFTSMSKEITDSCVAHINRIDALFTIVAGDLTHNNTQNERKDCKESLDNLVRPYYVVPGNHDIGYTVTPQSLEDYRNFWGPDYYAFSYNSCLFLGLNSSLIECPEPRDEHKKQNDFLLATLEQLDEYSHIFWFFHYPIYENSPTEANGGRSIDRPYRDKLLKYLINYNIRAVFTGHLHLNRIHYYGSTELITGISSSGYPDSLPAGYRITKVYENGIESFPVTVYNTGLFQPGIDTVRMEKIVTPIINNIVDGTVCFEFDMKIDTLNYPDWKNLTYRWNFGDGNFSTQKNVVHSYSAVGEYYVTARASNQNVVASYQLKVAIKTIEPSILKATPDSLTNTVSITYLIRKDLSVSPVIKIYNLSGKIIKTFTCSKNLGVYTIVWDGSDNNGKYMPSGTYFCAIGTSGIKKASKIVFLRK